MTQRLKAYKSFLFNQHCGKSSHLSMLALFLLTKSIHYAIL